MEKGESPWKALQREVQEETGYAVEPKHLIGIYSATYKDDLVLFFAAEILSQSEWASNAEIAQWKFFDQGELPQPMHPNALTRIHDAFEKRTGLIRIFEEDRG